MKKYLIHFLLSSLFVTGGLGYQSYLSYQQKILSLSSKLDMMKYKNKVFKQKVKKFRIGFIKKSVFRMKKKVASIPAKAIPFIGGATVLAMTAYEIKEICEDIENLYSLEESLTKEEDRNTSSLLKRFCD